MHTNPRAEENHTAAETSGSSMKTLSWVGYLSALLSGTLAISWAVSVVVQNILSPPAPWSGIQAYAASFTMIKMINLIPALALAPAYLVMMVCVYFYTPADKKLWSMIGPAFTIVYAVMASINYLIQLIAVGPGLSAGQTEGLALWAGDNFHSIFWALANSYSYMSVGMFFTAWAFDGGRLESWIHKVYLIVGSTAPLQFAFSFTSSLVLGVPGLFAWVLGTPLTCFMLAALFRRMPGGLTHA